MMHEYGFSYVSNPVVHRLRCLDESVLVDVAFDARIQ